MFEPVTKTLQTLSPAVTVPTTTPTANLIQIDDVKEEPFHLDDLDEIEAPGELYTQALAEIPERLRDDGKLGLNTENHTIGDWNYEVAGDKLIVRKGDEEDEILVDDYDTWRLLLVFNPKKIHMETDLPFVREYARIVNRLDLVERYERLSSRMKRNKYKLLKKMHEGSGFLFTTRSPTLIHPDTVVVPSDPEGLMNALNLALAEFRAGNISMRNVVVPLAAEASRMDILPRNLLSNNEKTWVFA